MWHKPNKVMFKAIQFIFAVVVLYNKIMGLPILCIASTIILLCETMAVLKLLLTRRMRKRPAPYQALIYKCSKSFDLRPRHVSLYIFATKLNLLL